VFAEFLLFLLIFPWGHSGVGLTVYFWGDFWFSICRSLSAILGAVKARWGFVPSYTCAGRESYFSYYSY